MCGSPKELRVVGVGQVLSLYNYKTERESLLFGLLHQGNCERNTDKSRKDDISSSS